MTLLSRIVRFVGWSPIHKNVSIIIDESEKTSLLKKNIVGRIISIEGAEKAIIQLDERSKPLFNNIELLVLRVRHMGYDLYYLPFGSIAVTLEKFESKSKDTRFALGIMKVI